MRRQRTFIGPQGMAGMVSLWGAPSLIKSIQRGTVTFSGTSTTATISAVIPENAYVANLGIKSGTAGQFGGEYFTRISLTNATTLTFLTNTATGTNRVVSYEVVEFMPGVIKSKQTGSTTSTGATTNQAVTEVNLNRAFLVHAGLIDNVGAAANDVATYLALTTSTNLAVVTGNPNVQITNWQLLELF